MDMITAYRYFVVASLRNAMRFGCRQYVPFNGHTDLEKASPQLRSYAVSVSENWQNALSEAGFDARQQSFGDLSVLSSQMPKADFSRLLRDIAALWRKGSSLVLDYAFFPLAEDTVCYDPLEMELLLPDCGFFVYEHPAPDALMRRYFRENAGEKSFVLLPGRRCLLAVRR